MAPLQRGAVAEADAVVRADRIRHARHDGGGREYRPVASRAGEVVVGHTKVQRHGGSVFRRRPLPDVYRRVRDDHRTVAGELQIAFHAVAEHLQATPEGRRGARPQVQAGLAEIRQLSVEDDIRPGQYLDAVRQAVSLRPRAVERRGDRDVASEAELGGVVVEVHRACGRAEPVGRRHLNRAGIKRERARMRAGGVQLQRAVSRQRDALIAPPRRVDLQRAVRADGPRLRTARHRDRPAHRPRGRRRRG